MQQSCTLEPKFLTISKINRVNFIKTERVRCREQGKHAKTNLHHIFNEMLTASSNDGVENLFARKSNLLSFSVDHKK